MKRITVTHLLVSRCPGVGIERLALREGGREKPTDGQCGRLGKNPRNWQDISIESLA